MLWGLHCAPFVSLLGTFMASLEYLGQSWGTLWDTWVSIRTALEILSPPETPPQADGSQVPRLRTKTDPLEFTLRSRRSRRFRRNGPQTTVQGPRSTRAGDQDDVSFTNSLKLPESWFFDTHVRRWIHPRHLESAIPGIMTFCGPDYRKEPRR